MPRAFFLSMKGFAALLGASILGGTMNWIATGEESMVATDRADAALQSAFQAGLAKVGDLRKTDRSTVLDCTGYFREFHKYEEVTPYIAFFDANNIPTITIDMNQRHYVYWEITDQRLWSMGYKSFRRGDRLVIRFTTDSSSSVKIKTFKTTVLNSYHL